MYLKSFYPPLPDLPKQNVHHILFNRPDQSSWPDFTFQVDVLTGERRTFREFYARLRDGATALGTDVAHGGLGIHRENDEIVAVLSENCLDYAALVHSLLAIAVPFATLSSYATVSEFQHAMELSRATRLFVSPSLVHRARDSGLPRDRVYILDGEVDGHVSYAGLVKRVQQNRMPRLEIRPANGDTLAGLILSSGTTGLPKAVMVTHGNLTASILQLIVIGQEVSKVQEPPKWNGPEGIRVLFNVLPLSHSFGLSMTTSVCLLQPMTTLFLRKWNVDTFFDVIPKYRVTNLSIVPSLIHQIVHHPRFLATDFGSVQAIHCGAAYLPVQLADRFLSRFTGVERIGEGYGMSEATFAISTTPAPGLFGGRVPNVPGSAGTLAPGMEARIMREDGTLAAVNEVGELQVRGDSVSPGYWKNEGATKAAFVDGWLRTGDRMRIDANGLLYFEDRAKDTLKVSGMQVSPMEIENAILDHPEKLVVDVAVAGVSGGRTTDEHVPRAWIVLSAAGRELGGKEATERIDRWVRERLSKYKWVRGGIGVVDRIPKSPTGKVLRRQLVDEYEASRATMAKL